MTWAPNSCHSLFITTHLVCSSSRRWDQSSHSLRHMSRPQGYSPHPPHTQTGPSCTPQGLKIRRLEFNWYLVLVLFKRPHNQSMFLVATTWVFVQYVFTELSIPRLCFTPSNMLVSTYTLRPIVSALTIFQHWELSLISSRLLHPNINCGEEEAGERRWTEEKIRRMTAVGDEKRVGSYSPNFAKWFDNTIVFSNEPYSKFSHGFYTDNHSNSRFRKMHKCTCITF